jgi:hypothetical protein
MELLPFDRDNDAPPARVISFDPFTNRTYQYFYVTYELNAYTDSPREVLNIYSDLHRNFQDKFNDADVEICAPHFSALRDRNTIAIPEQYIKSDYKAPAFRIKLADAAKNGAYRATSISGKMFRMAGASLFSAVSPDAANAGASQ